MFERKILNKFLQMIRQAYSSVVSPDTSEYPQGQVTSNGKATTITRLSTYGIIANPPLDSHVLMLQSQGQESTKFGIYNDFLRRKKRLAEGECALYNTLTGAIVYMKSDGSIAIESDTEVDVKAPVINAEATTSATVKAPTITLDGNVTVTGNLTVDGSISGSGGGSALMPNGADIDGIPFDTHVHGGVDTGTGTSGGPQ